MTEHVPEDNITELVGEYRHELVLHAYRMLGRLDEAEDAVQDASLRAWRGQQGFRGESSARTWLHRLVTNVCLDLRAKGERRSSILAKGTVRDGVAVPIAATVPWLQACPDSMLDAVAAQPEVDARLTSRETVEIGFIAALQHLPDRQRAVFLLRDTAGWSARETADQLEMSVPATNSALNRARTTMREVLGAGREEWSRSETSATEDAFVERWVTAVEAGDDGAIAALLDEQVVVSHQPAAGQDTDQIGWYAGVATVIEAWAPALHTEPSLDMRLLPLRVNRQPALASYIRVPGQPGRQAFGLEILRLRQGRAREVINLRADQFPQLGLPEALDD